MTTIHRIFTLYEWQENRTLTSPGDFGDTRGTFNPDWWPPHLNQYGMLKLIRITKEGSYIDGCRISDVTLDDIGLDYKSDIHFRIAVTDGPVNKRGLTIFGKTSATTVKACSHGCFITYRKTRVRSCCTENKSSP